MSYSVTTSKEEKVEKRSIVVTSDVYLDLVLLKLFNVHHGCVFFFF